ncbi:hypothetical protein CCH79_00008686 [Gambusia affinis]|uniref:Cyclin-dependent kinases regulatory subunit n=1 Tax=Gambusia affinis TaxID=33528 RepID=A0A315UTS2_GAMAF|nr:hypothetical protein CCH79_00008686 [Gambusia affinis]
MYDPDPKDACVHTYLYTAGRGCTDQRLTDTSAQLYLTVGLTRVDNSTDPVAAEWTPASAMSHKQIYYSDKYDDDKYEYRHVMLPKDIAKRVPKTHLMSETEWRNLGVQQSQGWVHYMIHQPVQAAEAFHCSPYVEQGDSIWDCMSRYGDRFNKYIDSEDCPNVNIKPLP